MHSLSGIIPLGAFLLVHLWTNATAPRGRACFDHAVAGLAALPALPLIEVTFILLPLAFHALVGVALTLESRPNVARYGYGHNWMYLLQRVTGLLALAFILVHLGDFWLLKVAGRLPWQNFFDELGHQLGNRWKALFYLFGTTACVFHFVNGLRTFAFAIGLTPSARARRMTAYAVAALGSLLWLLGAETVVFFATGGASLLPTSFVRGESGRDLCEDAHPLPVPR